MCLKYQIKEEAWYYLTSMEENDADKLICQLTVKSPVQNLYFYIYKELLFSCPMVFVYQLHFVLTGDRLYVETWDNVCSNKSANYKLSCPFFLVMKNAKNTHSWSHWLIIFVCWQQFGAHWWLSGFLVSYQTLARKWERATNRKQRNVLPVGRWCSTG